MSPQEESASEKRPYRKPQMTRVKLVTEEAVFAGCKTPSSGRAQGQTTRCQYDNWGQTQNCNAQLS